MSALELKYAHTDLSESINEYGGTVKIQFNNTENNVDRDEYNEIKKVGLNSPITIDFKSLPISLNPTVKELDNVGIIEKRDALFHFSKKDFVTNAIDIYGFDIDTLRGKVIYLEKRYEIKDVKFDWPFHNDYLYVILGCNRI